MSEQESETATKIPHDWGLPGWSAERFKAFNDARRKVHEIMQRFDDRFAGKDAIGGKVQSRSCGPMILIQDKIAVSVSE